MASVKEKTAKRSPSKTDTTGENTSTPTVINTFANDGSFLELFKKRMEAESQKLQSKSESTVGQSTSCEKKDEKTVDKESCTKRDNDGKAPGPSLPLTQQGKRQFTVGKMGGASRQIHAKKMKKDKEAAEAVKKAQEEEESKSSAWKAYMEEVKKYKEMSCSDDSDRVTPLVK
ncbi:hypothetical protein pdam_00011931 [Pocillopora damicornis]|uniref:Telomerase RNA component interacting RNase n=1 Tax=Pocillopora damicornis TaxID=46731 RepID=A0A3M6U090_POCDA|nr:telomerase RNA component interacting RNase-like [Pocillopora damicornis]XP_058968350.1 telomerase RNA component interacting RNase-like [Pocillopora verrucosa]RMX46954.1 hypothetical protein pdam_00011931 [Pocillopora damicornis]